jgi:phenylpropionate dioxygenase-like ring-hydroxylating dioxygenase large terminal subunit
MHDGLLPARVFNDPELHSREIDRIFTRAWTFIGHESEIPSPGDYVLRYVGNDAFIFARDENGVVRLLFDSCRHRGTQVCRAEQGNASHFRCSYHGWTYKNTGELIGAPGFKDAYGGGRFNRKDWALYSAPKLESVHGLYFASLDERAPSLDEYLGEMRWYLDLLFGLDAGGLEVVGEPQRWVMTGNWKNPSDQFAGDDYHTLFLHKSMWEVGVIQIPAAANMMGYHIQAGNGHVLSFSMAPDPNDPGPKYLGYPEELVATFENELTSEQREIARRARVMVGTVFPNFGFLGLPLTHDPRIPPTGILTIQMFRPLDHDRTEMWAWYLVWKKAPEELKEQSYRAAMGTFSSSGTFEQDDAEPWASISRAGGSAFARKVGMKYNFQMGLEGIGCAALADDFPGPGVVFWPRFEEGIQRSLYRRWLDYMTAEEYPPSTNGRV